MIAAVLLLSACGGASTTPEGKGTDHADTLKPTADSAQAAAPSISDLPAGWHVPDTLRWSAYWWTNYKDSTGTLAVRKADLDGDGALDHAVVVERSAGPGTKQEQGVHVRFANGADTMFMMEAVDGGLDTLGFGLTIWPPDDIDHLGSDTEDIPSLFHSEQPVLSVIYFEKSAVSYLWMNGRLHAVWTGD